MGRRIVKKAIPKYFRKVFSGEKKFEVRLSDWECKKGDTLVLKEWDPKEKKYTGRKIKKKVTFVLFTKKMEKFWTDEEIKRYGLQIISLE